MLNLAVFFFDLNENSQSRRLYSSTSVNWLPVWLYQDVQNTLPRDREQTADTFVILFANVFNWINV